MRERKENWRLCDVSWPGRGSADDEGSLIKTRVGEWSTSPSPSNQPAPTHNWFLSFQLPIPLASRSTRMIALPLDGSRSRSLSFIGCSSKPRLLTPLPSPKVSASLPYRNQFWMYFPEYSLQYTVFLPRFASRISGLTWVLSVPTMLPPWYGMGCSYWFC